MHPFDLDDHQPHDRRPIDALLAGYAAGTLSSPLHALVAAHLEIRSDNRGFVAALEAMRGDAMSYEMPTPLSARDSMLASIFEADSTAARPRLRSTSVALPDALERYMGLTLGEVAWRTRLPGVREYSIPDSAAGDAVLYWIRAGRRMPSHTHDGSEVTLVLRGAFHDATGRYVRGDVAIADAELDHTPVADAGEDCLCFAVTDAPLRLTGPIGRLVSRLLRH